MTESRSVTREKFVARFGEEQAARIEAAAEGHANGLNSENKGSDPFKWALLIAIGYQCVAVERYAGYHGITIPNADFEQFCMDDAELSTHDGDCDYLSLFGGRYNRYASRPVA